MISSEQPMKVTVGAIRIKKNNAGDDGTFPPPPITSREGSTIHASNVALASLCDNKFIRNKRRCDMKQISGIDTDGKVLTIDEDIKKTKSRTRVLEPESLVPKIARDILPRVEIVNGQIVLRESSLAITNQETTLAEGEYEEVEEGVHASSRYSSFSKKRKSTIWSLEETKQFYTALQQCGTEFSVMEVLFPKRTRKELKMKFFREENQHPELVKRALESSLPLELKAFEESVEEKTESAITIEEGDSEPPSGLLPV